MTHWRKHIYDNGDDVTHRMAQQERLSVMVAVMTVAIVIVVFGLFYA
jgi:hypothetical protein